MGGQLDGIFLAGSLPHELILSLSLSCLSQINLIWFDRRLSTLLTKWRTRLHWTRSLVHAVGNLLSSASSIIHRCQLLSYNVIDHSDTFIRFRFPLSCQVILTSTANTRCNIQSYTLVAAQYYEYASLSACRPDQVNVALLCPCHGGHFRIATP